MKVLYFSDNTSWHNQLFLEELLQAGLEVWFLDPTSDHLVEGWLPEGVRWVRSQQTVPRNADPTTWAGLLPEFQRLLREIKPDLIHAGPIQTCGYLTALSGFHPWLLASWGFDILFLAQRNLEWKQPTQSALSGADGFLCDCNAVRDAAKLWTDRHDSRIVQFPWGIKRGCFAPTGALPSKEDFQHEPGTHVFLCTRSWEPLYGIGTLLEAFHKAYQADTSLRLLLVGSGSQAGRVRNFIDAHGLTHAIRTPGPYGNGDMPKWFRAANTYVSCAQTDSTSISLLEAMATGLPVVVTDIPSNREWVSEGHNGWLAATDSAEEFSDRLLQAAHLCQEERKLFSERNKRIVEERADWDRNFPKLLEMYERLTRVSTGR